MIMSERTLKLLIDTGLPVDQLAEIMRSIEDDAEAFTPRPVERTSADRTRRWRARQASQSVTVTSQASQASHCDEDTPSLPPSPGPLSTNLTLEPPYIPPASDATKALAEQLWACQPKKFRRSTRPDVAKAAKAAIGRGASSAELTAAFGAYYRRPDCLKDDGEFAMGAAKLLSADRWRDFLPNLEPPGPATPEVLRWRLGRFRDTGEWRPEWGERPAEQAA